jgi:hypothetical protein
MPSGWGTGKHYARLSYKPDGDKITKREAGIILAQPKS